MKIYESYNKDSLDQQAENEGRAISDLNKLRPREKFFRNKKQRSLIGPKCDDITCPANRISDC